MLSRSPAQASTLPQWIPAGAKVVGMVLRGKAAWLPTLFFEKSLIEPKPPAAKIRLVVEQLEQNPLQPSH